MITPRHTRLLRVSDLQTFQRAIIETSCRHDVRRARSCAVIVPTRAAAEQLRRTIETRLPAGRDAAAVWLPDLVTRSEWYARMHGRLPNAPPLASEVEREAMAMAAARAAIAAGLRPPFALRPAIVAELLSFYDSLRRLEQSPDDFERLILGELQSSLDTDRGAQRLAAQTAFLAHALRGYEAAMTKAGLIDEHALRARLLTTDGSRLYREVVVAVADHVIDTEGLWPADFDLLARLPGLEELAIVATEALWATGLDERLLALLPGAEQERIPSHATIPVIVAPQDTEGRLFHTFRDREEELESIARNTQTGTMHQTAAAEGSSRRSLGDKTAVVFARPLPYVYVARQVFASSGVPCQTFDALPLASEPWAATVDIVCSLVLSDFTRASIVALLGCPQFALEVCGRSLTRADVTKLDHRLQEERFLGGRLQLVELAARWSRESTRSDEVAATAALAAALADELQDLEQNGRASVLLGSLINFLQRHGAPLAAGSLVGGRNLQARTAIMGTLESLRDAHLRHDDMVCRFSELGTLIKRRIEAQTFSPRAAEGGVQLIDANAATYGMFEDVHLVGLIDADWPENPRRTVFYPRSLLAQLGWPRERDRVRGARARFTDLLRLPSRRIFLSTFLLEDDAIVAPSILLEDVADAGLEVDRTSEAAAAGTSAEEAPAIDLAASFAADGSAAAWLALRMARRSSDERVFHGFIGSRPGGPYAVRSVERYLACPFQYFGDRVLGLGEERDDETTLSPRARGQLMHLVFARFLAEWGRLGHRTITPETLPVARSLLSSVAESLLQDLPEAEREVERTLLFGSAAGVGAAERFLRIEAEDPGDLLERLVEYPLEGDFGLRSEMGCRRLRLRGVADRIDLRPDGRFRVIDYKLGRAPRSGRAVQLPVYAVCAEQQLAGRHGCEWRVAEAAYVAFGDRRTYVAIGTKGGLARAVDQAQQRFVGAVDGIERGEFPPRPAELRLCRGCPFPAVCRKDYVGAD